MPNKDPPPLKEKKNKNKTDKQPALLGLGHKKVLMRISTSKSEAMNLNWKKVACTLQVGGKTLPQFEEFEYLLGLVNE